MPSIFISMPYLSTPSIRLCLLGLMCRVLRLLRNCLCLRKTKGREEEEVVITLFVLFDYVSLLTSSSIFFFFFIVVSFFLEEFSSHVALSLGRSSSIRLSSFRTVYPSGWLYLWPSIRPPFGHCLADVQPLSGQSPPPFGRCSTTAIWSLFCLSYLASARPLFGQ